MQSLSLIDQEDISRAGLCVIDNQTKKILVLVRDVPYNNFIVRTSSNANKDNKFVEQYSLPRGKSLGRFENLRYCAIREFIEETKLFFKDLKFSGEYFDLYWHDPIKWMYRIYFASASFSNKNLIRITKSYNLPKIGCVPIKVKNQKYEPLTPIFQEITTYIDLIKERLHLYGSNNYNELINKILLFAYPTIYDDKDYEAYSTPCRFTLKLEDFIRN